MNVIGQFFDNMRFFLFSRKARKRISILLEGMKALNYEVSMLRYKDSEEEDIRLAYDYLHKRQYCTDICPYEQTRSLDVIDVRYDDRLKMFFVMHKGCPLYYPKHMTEEEVHFLYRIAHEEEDILSEGYRQRTPHSYQSDRYHICDGDVLIDAGSAEGLLTLDVIDKVSKAYLVECDSRWWKPLEATFAPYKDKVEIVKGVLTGAKRDGGFGLTELLEKCRDRSVFVKMDIEGAELEVLQGAQEYLKTAKNQLILAVCAYHHVADYDQLNAFFNVIGYSTETQSGYMYTNLYEGNGIYSLRRGVIRASNV